MFFRFHYLRSGQAAVRARAVGRAQTPGDGAFKMFNSQKLKELIEKRKYAGSISEVLRLLATADQENFLLDRAMLRSPLADMVKRILSQREESFDASSLTGVIDHASSLNVLSQNQVTEAFKVVRASEPSSEWEKACLALWSASLWHGFPAVKFHSMCLRLLSGENLRWSSAVRLAWCVLNDPVTKMDPSLVLKVETIIKSSLEEKSLKELAELANSKLYSAESSVVRKAALEAIASRATSEAVVKEDNRIPSQLLCAWTEQRTMPEDTEFFGKVLNQCVRTGLNVHVLFEAVSTLNLGAKVDMQLLKRAVFGKISWKPSLEQQTSLCLSFAALGFNDLESTSFLAHHLNEILIKRNPDYHLPERLSQLWKVGVWYSFVTATANETTAAAFLDTYRELSKKIASGMWDSQGDFVAKETRPPPNVRAIRTVISQGLSSLGIANLQNVHVINTPYTASLLLPDREMVIALVDEKDVLTHSNEFIGEIQTMKNVVQAKGLSCKLLRVTEWEQSHASSTQDEFLASLLALTQSNNS